MEVLSAQAADTMGGGKVSQDALKPLKASMAGFA